MRRLLCEKIVNCSRKKRTRSIEVYRDSQAENRRPNRKSRAVVANVLADFPVGDENPCRLIKYKYFGSIHFPGELEADWLSEVGLGEWTQQWRQGKSLPENDIGPAVQKLSLKPHQVQFQNTFTIFVKVPCDHKLKCF